ncbi:hypothetical protein CK934_21380 [Chitinophaga sp. MD30]|nr:hypothetical protein CK934_21380 [Chitinophaga sp. MD30]
MVAQELVVIIHSGDIKPVSGYYNEALGDTFYMLAGILGLSDLNYPAISYEVFRGRRYYWEQTESDWQYIINSEGTTDHDTA